MTPFYEKDGITIYAGDCLEVLPWLAVDSMDLVLTDPPYFRVKTDSWDRQWESSADFLAWLDLSLMEFYRLLRTNGSLYVFASPQMAARVEVQIAERFNILNHIVWRKSNSAIIANSGQWNKTEKATLRSYFPQTERIIFAEHYGADNVAKGDGYTAKCEELRGFVFEPLRAYLDSERQRAGVRTGQIMEWFAGHGYPKYVTARHSFSTSQWALPTAENYERLRCCFQELGKCNEGEYLRREYEDLRREYEDLRREYEDLRRPFNAAAAAPFTDVWDFLTVPARVDKHPCEKPLPLLRHMIATSSRPDALILDPFMGSGTTLVAARNAGRRAVGIELDENYCRVAVERLRQRTLWTVATPTLTAEAPSAPRLPGLRDVP